MSVIAPTLSVSTAPSNTINVNSTLYIDNVTLFSGIIVVASVLEKKFLLLLGYSSYDIYISIEVASFNLAVYSI
jgi:hypothetical protein